MANKYEEAYKKAYKGLKGKSEDITSRSKSYANYAGEVSALPYNLKEEFRQRRDPAFDQKVSESEQKAFGGAIEGLNKYQDIQNPFQRRALAEKYQGGLQSGVQSLYDERDRRQGTILDYIDKWTGLFGAEAKKEELVLQAMKEGWQRESGMAGAEYGAASSGIAADQAQKQTDIANSQWDQEFQLNKDKFAFSKSQAGESGSATKVDNNFLEQAQKELEESRQHNEGLYHSDTYKKLYFDAPNSATRAIMKELLGGELDKSAQKKLGYWAGEEDKSKWEIDMAEEERVSSILESLRRQGYSDKEITEEMYRRGNGAVLKKYNLD